MPLSNEQIDRWATPPSETENERCENAISQITSALRGRFGTSITIIRQGSHRNRTNIRLDSDVDLAVVHENQYFAGTYFLSEGEKALYEQNRMPGAYNFYDFKNDVERALQDTFGSTVRRRNKCLHVPGNTNRINADVVPAFPHHRLKTWNTHSDKGIQFFTDGGESVVSYPIQHYENGVSKNTETGRAYKSVVRVMKNLRSHFAEKGEMSLKDMSSFFIESLVWNVPLSYFQTSSWRADTASVAFKVWQDMRAPAIADEYTEVSGLLWLFKGQTRRTHQQAQDFMLKVWAATREQ